MRAANPDNCAYLEIDQIVPSQNIGRVLRYFQDPIDVFVVDRDPRDIYILEKCYWKGHICPTDSVEDYCRWFLYTRNSGSADSRKINNVHYIQFEDLIFKYSEECKKIETLLGLNAADHINKYLKFNPKRSIVNTQLWKKHLQMSEEIKIIENELREYLYPFDEIDMSNIEGVESIENTPF